MEFRFQFCQQSSEWTRRHQVVFLVAKKTGGWRPVINLRAPYSYIDVPHFKMATVSLVLDFVCRGDWAYKLDLEHAYFHVLIHPESQKYLCFALHGRSSGKGCPIWLEHSTLSVQQADPCD